nr:ZIP family metal transporter [Candidatus Sigynarchaeota archaeon]
MEIGFALLFSLIGGLSTGIGSIIAYFIQKPKLSYLSFSLGLSAGVMTYIAFMELLPHSVSVLGEGLAIIWFFFGMLVVGFLDYLFPDIFIPRKNGNSENACEGNPKEIEPVLDRTGGKLAKIGTMVTLGLIIHQLPEGMIAFSGTLFDVNMGILIMVAIIFHNVPEGISVSLPVLFVTCNKKKAFWYSFLSGLAEPAGAVIAFVFLFPFLSGNVIAALLAFFGGVMIYLSLDTILPTARRYGHGHIVIIGVVVGMLIMSISLAFQ